MVARAHPKANRSLSQREPRRVVAADNPARRGFAFEQEN